MAIAGKGGNVKLGVNTVTEIKSWKLDVDIELKDKTNFGSNGWKEAVSGLKGWSGSMDGTWNIAADTTGQKALQDAYFAGTTVAIEFNVNGTNKYTGSAFVKKMKIDEPVDDLVKFSVDIEGTGALTYA